MVDYIWIFRKLLTKSLLNGCKKTKLQWCLRDDPFIELKLVSRWETKSRLKLSFFTMEEVWWGEEGLAVIFFGICTIQHAHKISGKGINSEMTTFINNIKLLWVVKSKANGKTYRKLSQS